MTANTERPGSPSIAIDHASMITTREDPHKVGNLTNVTSSEATGHDQPFQINVKPCARRKTENGVVEGTGVEVGWGRRWRGGEEKAPQVENYAQTNIHLLRCS